MLVSFSVEPFSVAGPDVVDSAGAACLVRGDVVTRRERRRLGRRGPGRHRLGRRWSLDHRRTPIQRRRRRLGLSLRRRRAVAEAHFQSPRRRRRLGQIRQLHRHPAQEVIQVGGEGWERGDSAGSRERRFGLRHRRRVRLGRFSRRLAGRRYRRRIRCRHAFLGRLRFESLAWRQLGLIEFRRGRLTRRRDGRLVHRRHHFRSRFFGHELRRLGDRLHLWRFVHRLRLFRLRLLHLRMLHRRGRQLVSRGESRLIVQINCGRNRRFDGGVHLIDVRRGRGAIDSSDAGADSVNATAVASVGCTTGANRGSSISLSRIGGADGSSIGSSAWLGSSSGAADAVSIVVTCRRRRRLHPRLERLRQRRLDVGDRFMLDRRRQLERHSDGLAAEILDQVRERGVFNLRVDRNRRRLGRQR